MNLFAPQLKPVNLRPYQIDAREKIRAEMRAGARRIILVAPTAFGKTETAIDLILRAMEKGSRVWFIVDRITLVDQTAERFFSYGIDAGIMQADNPGYDPGKQVQIWSAQTFERRVIDPEDEPHLIFVDEAHDQRKAVLAFIEQTRRAKAIGLTATPFSPGMADHWEAVVNGATVNQLLKLGFLSPLKVKACVSPDMAGAKKKFTGEYEDEEAGSRGVTIIGDVVQTWIQQTEIFFGGPAKTLVFSPSVKHGAELCRQFNEAGFNFQQISYLDGGNDDRRAKIEEFRKPNSAIDALVSCAVLTKGFDVPDVKIGISCRPYRKSFSSHIQEMGRVMRIAEGKDFGLWLDHSGNSIAFAEDTAFLFANGVDSLSDAAKRDSEVREPVEKIKKKHFCGECGMQMEPAAQACQACGWERPKRGEIRTVQGELIDLEISLQKTFQPRPGLRAECVKDPRAIWNAALAYTLPRAKSEEMARRWAYGVWHGIYPTSKLPHGLFDMRCNPNAVSGDQWALIDREVKRYRNNMKRGKAA